MTAERFPGCRVSPGARIADDVTLGYGTVVHEGVEIHRGVRVQEHCVLGAPVARGSAGALVIRDGSLIRSHSVLYLGSDLGPALETGHHVVIRERTRCGENLRVGNFCDIEGDCSIGDFARLHGYVHVGKGTRLGHFVWLFSLNTTLNDPLPPSDLSAPITIDDGAVLCFNATVMPGVTVGFGAYVSAGATVRSDVPPGAVVSGASGEVTGHVTRIFHMGTGTSHPWMNHYAHAYPESARARIEELHQRVRASRKGFVLRS